MQEFKVRIDVELPEEARERIERAVQKAALAALVDIDVADGYSVVMRAPATKGDAAARAGDREDLFGAFGSTYGIWFRDEKSMLG